MADESGPGDGAAVRRYAADEIETVLGEAAVPDYETPWGRGRPLSRDVLIAFQQGRVTVLRADLCATLLDYYQSGDPDYREARRKAFDNSAPPLADDATDQERRERAELRRRWVERGASSATGST